MVYRSKPRLFRDLNLDVQRFEPLLFRNLTLDIR